MEHWNSTRSSDSDRLRECNDIIHGFVQLDHFVWAIIDTQPFQRLKSLMQLGTTKHVWPCAEHSRFVHSLGVAHLARMVVKHLQQQQPELGIMDREVCCVQLAGLCHDLGHGPYSHVFDGRFIPLVVESGGLPDSDRNWCHEQASVMMLDYILTEEKLEMAPEDLKFVKALISGDHTETPDEKRFLFDIIANKRNGIDVDKFDYIVRDTHMFSHNTDLCLSKLIASSRVIDDQICYDHKDSDMLIEMCHKRYYLHKSHYNHKTATAIEFMYCDGLLSADKFLKISAKIHDPSKYRYLKDSIVDRIEESEDKELADARSILNRIRRRDLYKCVDYNYIDYDYHQTCLTNITPEKIVEAYLKLPKGGSPTSSSAPTPSLLMNQDPEEVDAMNDEETMTEADEAEGQGEAKELTKEDVIVDTVLLHHGMKDKNPLDFVRFYSKKRNNVSFKASPGSVSSIQLTKYAEVLMRVYVKDVRHFRAVQAGYRELLRQMPEHVLKFHLANPAADIDGHAPASQNAETIQPVTPPSTQAPSTPRRTPSASGLPHNEEVLRRTLGREFSENVFTSLEDNGSAGSCGSGEGMLLGGIGGSPTPTKKPRSRQGRGGKRERSPSILGRNGGLTKKVKT